MGVDENLWLTFNRTSCFLLSMPLCILIHTSLIIHLVAIMTSSLFLSRKLITFFATRFCGHKLLRTETQNKKATPKRVKLTVESLIETELASFHAFVFIECGKNVNFNVWSNNNEYNLRNWARNGEKESRKIRLSAVRRDTCACIDRETCARRRTTVAHLCVDVKNLNWSS